MSIIRLSCFNISKPLLRQSHSFAIALQTQALPQFPFEKPRSPKEPLLGSKFLESRLLASLHGAAWSFVGLGFLPKREAGKLLSWGALAGRVTAAALCLGYMYDYFGKSEKSCEDKKDLGRMIGGVVGGMVGVGVSRLFGRISLAGNKSVGALPAFGAAGANIGELVVSSLSESSADR